MVEHVILETLNCLKHEVHERSVAVLPHLASAIDHLISFTSYQKFAFQEKVIVVPTVYPNICMFVSSIKTSARSIALLMTAKMRKLDPNV